MSGLRAIVQENEPERILRSEAELDLVLREAAAQAEAAGVLNILVLQAPNGDQLSLVLGGNETVLAFNFGHGNPPYFASSGTAADDEPVLTAYVGLEHHTEFPRRWVIPMAEGVEAAAQFLRTGARPSVVEWVEV